VKRWRDGLVGFLIGIPVLLLSLFLFCRTTLFLYSAKTAAGVVDHYEIETTPGEDGGTTYHPVVHFKTPDAASHSFRDRSGSSSPGAVGTSVQVVYDPGEPSKARIKSFFTLWMGVTVTAIFGTIITGIAFLVVLVE
jgi:hypothetical protein